MLANLPLCHMLPGQHLPPALGTFHTGTGLLQVGAHGTVPFITAPAAFCLVPLNKGNLSVPKTKVLTHPVPQDHESGQAGTVASRPENLLEDLAAAFKPKDETPIKRRLTQGIVWNKDPGLFTLVGSSWTTKVGGERPGRDCPTAVHRISGPGWRDSSGRG